MLTSILSTSRACILCCLFATMAFEAQPARGNHDHHEQVEFSIRSVRDGNWSDAATWQPARIPKAGDRVLVARGTHVNYNRKSADVIRLVQVVGTLRFAGDRDTELNVGLITIQHT
ncbi:MAG: hypothetical protein RIS70_89, partial [Planctomycetota bacterium]